MSAKNLILDFLNLIFIIIIIGLAIFFIISPGYFEAFTKIMKAFLPLSLFGVVFLIKFKLARNEFSRKVNEDQNNLVLYLDYMDKLKSDLVIFSLPILIIVISLFSEQGFTTNDLFQAALSFLVVYFWYRYLLSKAR